MRFIFLISLIIIHKYSFADESILSGADIDYGEYLSGECVACHKKNATNEAIPSIHGKDADVIAALLVAYRDKDMENEVMQMVAGRLDDEQIGSLAVYFSKN